MGRSPNYDASLTRGPWSKDEDGILRSYIERNGVGNWKELPKLAGLKRCGKSCRLRWINYLQPGIKRGNFSEDEEKLIVNLHKDFGNRWSRIADQLEGRTDNEIKNYWNTTIKKKLLMKGIDPVTHQRRANFNILQNFPNLLATASNLNDLAPNALNNNDTFHQITPNVQLLQTLINSIINSSLIPNMEAMIQLQSLIALHNSNHSTLNGFGTNNSSAGTSYFSSPATNATPYVQNTANTTPLQVSSSIADHDSLNQTTFGYPVFDTNVFGLSGSFMNHGGCNSSGFGMNNSSASTLYFSSPDTNAMPYVQNTANTILSLQVSSPIADHDSLNQTTFGHSVSNTNVFGLTGSFMNHGGCNSSGFGMNNGGVDASTSNVNDTTATTSYFSSPNATFMPLQPSINAMPSVQITSSQNMSRSQAFDEENVTSTSSDSLEFNWKDLLSACSGTDM